MDAFSSSHAGFNKTVFIHITLQTCFIWSWLSWRRLYVKWKMAIG